VGFLGNAGLSDAGLLDAAQVRSILNANVIVNFNPATSPIEPIVSISARP
jgi:hypothetical protein